VKTSYGKVMRRIVEARREKVREMKKQGLNNS
jgi:hypothetical protein